MTSDTVTPEHSEVNGGQQRSKKVKSEGGWGGGGGAGRRGEKTKQRIELLMRENKTERTEDGKLC